MFEQRPGQSTQAIKPMKTTRFTATAVTLCLLIGALRSIAAPDVTRGKKVFEQCSACHSADAANGLGPSLFGVIGRKAGLLAGFRYSRAMRNSQIIWGARTLDAYIADPQSVVPGNLMPYSGLPDASQRADLIAYLESLQL
jgi:cytochrome c